MYHFFVEPEAIVGNTIHITGGDVNHIKNVLRMHIGEELAVSNGMDGKEYRCGITSMTEDEILCELYFVKEEAVELASRITLFQGLPKSDKMELIIQKAIELGVFEIVPVVTERTIVKLDPKKEKSKLGRWQGIAEAAAKQSKRGIIPAVHAPVRFQDALKLAEKLDSKVIPYELAEDMEYTREVFSKIMPGQSIGVFIGPEGGFSEKEIAMAKQAGVHPITLGRRILRTETAGITVLSILMYLLEDRK